jgi:multidrug resistance efflux pump
MPGDSADRPRPPRRRVPAAPTAPEGRPVAVALIGLLTPVALAALGVLASLAAPASSAAGAARATVTELHETGTIAAVHTVAVNSPPVCGDSRVVDLVAEGTIVMPGDTLVVLANERFADALAEVAADLAVQRKVLTSRRTQNAANAVAAANAITKARLAREAAELAEYNQRFAAPLERERAELSRRQAEIDLARARQDSVAQAQLDSLALARAELRRDRLQARVRRYRNYLDQLVLVSPADGMVVYHRERTDEGVQVVRSGDTVGWGQHLLDITDVSALQVEMEVHERDRGRIAPGQRVIAAPEAYPGVTYPGHVTRVQSLPLDAEAGSAARRFLVTARLDRVDANLRPGMSVRATIILEDPDAVP